LKKPTRRTIAWLVTAMTIAGMVAVVRPAINSARMAARRQRRTSNIEQIGLALQNWCDIYKRLPPAVHRDDQGRPLSSWRFRIMPYVHAIMFDVDFETTWDAPVNRYIASTCGDYFGVGIGDPASAPRNTKLMALTGPGTAFEEGTEHNLKDLPNDLILAIEVADSGVHWMEPGDLHVSDITTETLQGLHGKGVLVLFVDEAVRYVPSSTPIDDFKLFLTIDGAKDHDREMLFPNQR
jgi:Protein of unknown function (DUF1559)